MPSLFLNSSVNLDEYINDMLKWEKDLQYIIMNINVSGNSKQKSEIPKTLLQALGACDRDSFPNIHFLLLVVGCTLPISSAEVERSFSLMKTYIRKIGYDRRTLF